MARFSVSYDDRLTDDEKDLLESKQAAVMDALKATSLYWTFVDDDQGHRHFQLQNNARTECFLQLVRWELEQFDDEKIKHMITGRSRPCTDPPQSST